MMIASSCWFHRRWRWEHHHCPLVSEEDQFTPCRYLQFGVFIAVSVFFFGTHISRNVMLFRPLSQSQYALYFFCLGINGGRWTAIICFYVLNNLIFANPGMGQYDHWICCEDVLWFRSFHDDTSYSKEHHGGLLLLVNDYHYISMLTAYNFRQMAYMYVASLHDKGYLWASVPLYRKSVPTPCTSNRILLQVLSELLSIPAINALKM